MIDAEAYGPASITLDLFRNLWRVFPNGLVAIFEDDTIIGAFGIWPLTEKWAEGLRSGKLRELDLDPISMAKFRKCAARKWYISGVVLSPAARDRAIILLLSDGLRLWRREAKLSFSCEFLALAWSDEGRALLKGFEFYPIREATETLDEMPLYQRLFEEEDDLIEMMRRRGLAIG